MSDISQMLEEYVTIAEWLDEKQAELKPASEALGNIKAALLAKMNELELNSLKSNAGHAIVRVKSLSAKVVDAEAFFDFVFDTGDTSFLTKHVSKEAVDDYLTRENTLPPGIASESVITLRFTKAKK